MTAVTFVTTRRIAPHSGAAVATDNDRVHELAT